MSDTPRTDAVDSAAECEVHAAFFQMRSHAWTLERELNESTTYAASLKETCEQMGERYRETRRDLDLLTTALRAIANTDYRGNRSSESTIAHKALTIAGITP